MGFVFKHLGLINDNFVTISSRLVFNATLPILIFLKVSTSSSLDTIPVDGVGIIYGVTIGVFVLTWWLAKHCIQRGADLGAFLQGSYRGNFATVGLAASAGIYGSEGLALAALFLAFVVPLFNVLGLVALLVPQGKERRLSRVQLIKELFLNPIMVAVILAIPLAYFSISLPIWATNTGQYLAQLTIPLALLGVGANMQFHGRDYSLTQACIASAIKIIVLPLAGIAIALILMLPAQTVGILFIFFACPTTMASFIVAQALGANEKLASAIVVISTCISPLTMVVGLNLLALIS